MTTQPFLVHFPLAALAALAALVLVTTAVALHLPPVRHPSASTVARLMAAKRYREKQRSSHTHQTINTSSSSLTPVSRKGYVFDYCVSDKDCVSPRRCFHVDTTGDVDFGEYLCDNNINCVCLHDREVNDGYPFEYCESCSECSAKPFEVCATTGENVFPYCVAQSALGESLEQVRLCPTPTPSKSASPTSSYSPTPTPTSTSSPSPNEIKTPSEGGGCIDAAVVRASGTGAVFSMDRRASVLCDVHGSCATAGHMVEYDGQAMSMRQYCAMIERQVGGEGQGCRRRVMLVNSPRFQRRLRLESYTHRLKYTAVAARYETGVEETLLRMALQLGM